MGRASSLSPPEFFLLTAWAKIVYDAFGEMPYLVGSVARAEPFRDVDVRMMLDTGDPLLADPLRMDALNVAVSLWGQRATGLPIDFQFQDADTANAEHDGPRNAIGIHGDDRVPRASVPVQEESGDAVD